MKPPINKDLPQDDLLQRYEQAKAVLSDGLPDAPPAALHERIMQAASEQINAIKTVAAPAHSMPGNGQNGLKNQAKTAPKSPEAANDSIWNIKLVASLAVMGLSGLLWWQFEHGTPEERVAAKSAQPSAAIVAAASTPASPPASASVALSEPTSESAPAHAAAAATKAKIASAAPAPAARQESQAAQAKPAAAEPTAPGAAAMQAPSATAEAPSAIAADVSSSKAAPLALPKRSTDMAQASSEATSTAPPSAPPSPAVASARAAVPPMAASAAAPRAAPVPAAAANANPSPLFAAIQAKDAAALRQALSQGASLNARNADGNPALTQAVIQRWPEGARILLSSGADKAAKNTKGHTAADVALELGYADMADLLNTTK